MADKSEKAVDFFTGNFNCAQSVLASFSGETGISEDECLRMATAFGGGMALSQMSCGAVTGALMAIGMMYGKGLEDTDERKTRTYELSTQFMQKFREQFGSIQCIDLLDNLRFNVPEERNRMDEQEIFRNKCRNYVVFAVEELERLVKTGNGEPINQS